MPTAATAAGQRPVQSKKAPGGQAPMAAAVPFIRASARHREPTGFDVTTTMTGSDQTLTVAEVPAYGYIRYIGILVTASGGTGGTPNVALSEKGVLAALKNIYFTEPNGAVIAQFNDSYDMYLANKWGGYANVVGGDPTKSPAYVNATSAFGSFSWYLRIPIELNGRDGLGALPNQNAAATFKLRMSVAGSSSYGTGTFPTTLPNVRVRVYTEAWDQPEIASGGATNQVSPPAVNTTQFWTSQTYTVNSGQNTIRLTRVGNYIRTLVGYITDNSSSFLAGETIWQNADPVYLYKDARPMDIIQPTLWRDEMFRKSGYALDNGVRVYDFNSEFDGTYGHENRDLWLPTLGSTRLEFQFNASSAGKLTVLTNDVAITGANVFL